MPATPAVYHHAKLSKTRVQSTFQRSHHGCGDARGVPVHAHHSAECLEPEWITQPCQKRTHAIFQNDMFGNGRAKLFHAVREPRWNMATVQRKIGCP